MKTIDGLINEAFRVYQCTLDINQAIASYEYSFKQQYRKTLTKDAYDEAKCILLDKVLDLGYL